MAIFVEQVGCAPCARKAALRGFGRAGLGGLGGDNVLTDIFNSFHTAWGDFTGSAANQKAAEQALALQKLQAEAAVAEAQSRSETLKTVVPWIAGGALFLVAAVVAVKVLK